MEIHTSLTNFRVSLERINNSLLESLRDGQMLQARALTSTQSNQVQLRIGTLDILAHTQAKITAGENLTLQVIKAANPLQLRVLKEIDSRHIQAEAMRAALPQQSSVSHLLKRLNILTLVQPPQTGQVGQSGQQSLPGSRTEALTQSLKLILQPLSTATVLGQKGGGAAPVISTPLVASTAHTALLPTNTDNKAQPIINNLMQSTDGAKLFQAISQLLAFQVAPDEKLSAERIRQVFENSGLFLESALVRGSDTTSDMKRSILELLLHLRPLLAAARATQQPVSSALVERTVDPILLFAEIVSQAEGSLARILFNQLSSLPSDNSNQQIWQFELPFRQGEKNDSFRVQIERETKQNGPGKAETLWSVKLDFDLEPIGPIQARLVLIGEEISSRFTAEYAETADRLDQALPYLAKSFARAGLKIGTLSATSGAIDDAPRPRFPLLDEKA